MAFTDPVLIVSRPLFLDRIVDKILELENGEVKVYGGNYSLYKQQKQIELESHLRNYEKQQKQIQKLQADLLRKEILFKKVVLMYHQQEIRISLQLLSCQSSRAQIWETDTSLGKQNRKY